MTDAAAPAASAPPRINAVTGADLRAALAEGWGDFRAAPAFGLFFAAVTVLGGLVILLQLQVWGQTWLIIPVSLGFPLLGPFFAVGLYEVSRRIDTGEALDWAGVLGVVFRQKDRQLPSMIMVVIMIFLFWMYAAHLVFALSFGLKAMTNIMSSPEIFFSPTGLLMLAIGSLVGFLLALLLFSITVFGLPMLLDREVDVVTAMVTSVRAVSASPGPMLGFAAVTAALLLGGLAPFFLGLFVALPLLGHTTWRLYRRALIYPG